MTRRAHTLVSILVLTAVYFFAGKFGLSWAVLHASASAVWPPSGIALAALLLYGYRLWPGIFLGAFLVNITTQAALGTTIGITAGNTLEALLAAWIVCRFAGGARAFERAKNIPKFILFAILSTALGATFGVTSLAVGGLASWAQYQAIWLTWWLGDLVGILIITPLLALWGTQPFPPLKTRRTLEASFLSASVLIVARIVFLSKIPSGLEYLAVPPVLWAAFRFGERGAVTTAFLMSAVAVWGASLGLGPFTTADANHSLLLLQFFMGTVATTGLVLASALAERKRAEDALRDNESRLRLAMATGRMGAWEWNVADNQVTWSPTLEEIHGLKPGTFGGRFEDFKRDVHPEDLDPLLAEIEKTLERRGDYHAAYRIIRPTGEIRWVEAFGSIVFGARNQPEKLLGVCMDVTERKGAEEVLRTKEAQLRLITDTAPVLLVQRDRDGRYKFVNRAYAERLGLTPEQIVGKSISEVLGEEAYQAIRSHVDRVLKGQSVEYETEVPYRQLGRRFMRVAYLPEKDAQGNVVGWVAALSDITERRRAEEMLRQRTRSLEIINQVGNALAAELDLKRIVQMVTDAAREISGAEFGVFFYSVKNERGGSDLRYALSGVRREELGKFSPSPNAPLFAAMFGGEGVLRIGDVSQDPRYSKISHGGMPEGYFPARSCLAVPVVSRSGEVFGGMFFGHAEPDVFTEAAENIITAVAAQTAVAIDNANLYQAVQRRVEEFRKLIDTAPVGIAVATDAQCRNIWGNPEFAQMLGTNAGENISKSRPGGQELSFEVRRSGREVAAEDLPMQRACREGIDVLDEELEIVRSDGQVVHELCRATPLRDEHGKVRGCIGVFLNITDRKQAEQALQQAKDALARSNEDLERRVRQRTAELEQANAALLRDMEEQKMLEDQLRHAQKMESIGTLAGGVAHDFNNLLNIIKGYASLLGRRRPGDRELAESLKVIDETIERGASTVRQLLALGRNSEIQFEPVDMNGVLENLTSLLTDTFPRTIDIASSLEPDLPPVMADPNQINQVMLNICVNARDAMPGGGELLLVTATARGEELRERFQEARDDLYVSVSVTDTGSGMGEVVKSRIFEPFFTTKEQGQGTGLGLSVVYGIVIKHRGFIDVSSEPGRGTTFRVYLPVADQQAAAIGQKRSPEPNAPAGAGAAGATILFVEDEVKQLELMRKFLESEGYTVLAARDGAEAFETYLRHRSEIAVVVLDLGLPKLNGWEVFQQMKQVDPTVKPILATGYMSPEMESALGKGELSAVIMKPYRLDELVGTISAAIPASGAA
jgi:PAS domain S-box-containing protein